MSTTTEPFLTKEQIEQINRPYVQSLLYDLNLLPEQLITLNHGPGHKHWSYMLSVLQHFQGLDTELSQSQAALLAERQRIMESLGGVLRDVGFADYDVAEVRSRLTVALRALPLKESTK